MQWFNKPKKENQEMPMQEAKSVCIYCGKPAPATTNVHSACAEMHDWGWSKVANLAKSYIIGSDSEMSLERLNQSIEQTAQTCFIKSSELRGALVEGWGQAVKHFLSDGNLSVEEQARLEAFANWFNLTSHELNIAGAYTLFVKGVVLRLTMTGVVPTFSSPNNLPFNFQKSEALVWTFSNVDYYEMKTRKEYVGGSVGASIRVAKGMYIHFSRYKGEPIEKTESVYVDRGIMTVTNKHLYFHGKVKSFRIRFDKIVSFTPYSDGVGIQRDAQTAKPQIFVTNDGWFTYNLLTNLARLY